MDLEQRGRVFVLRLGPGDNRLNPEQLSSLAAGLDAVEGESGPAALVTIGSADFYSNGYDLEWLRAQSPAAQRAFVESHERLLARLLRSTAPSVAAISGHAIGGGALVALAHDYRVMQVGRGAFWLPEIDVRIPFRPGMMALLQARLAPDVCRDLVLAGEKLRAERAREARVVDELADPAELLERAIARADALARKDRRTWGRMKARLYGSVADALDPPAGDADQSRGSP
jgi:enoyl-CoA hydratase/carnithine racemase